MGTDHKEKLIRVLQILEETDEKSPMNATQILKYLEEEYQIEQVDRRSVYRDIKIDNINSANSRRNMFCTNITNF